MPAIVPVWGGLHRGLLGTSESEKEAPPFGLDPFYSSLDHDIITHYDVTVHIINMISNITSSPCDHPWVLFLDTIAGSILL